MGRPLLLGVSLDNAVEQFTLKLKEKGCPVNMYHYIVRAAATGIVKAMDKDKLTEYGGPAHYLWHQNHC